MIVTVIVIFNFELTEALDLADNAVCYVDGILIPHTWRTIESYNNKLYIILMTTVVNSDTTETYNWFPYLITIPESNYDGYRLASGIQDLINSIEINFTFEVKCNTAAGSIKIEETTEGSGNAFEVPSDFGVVYWDIETNNQYPWRNIEETTVYPDVNSLQSINGVLRNTEMLPVRLSYMYNTYQSGFIDLSNIHNVYTHCPNLGHFKSIGVRGESTIIKKVSVSSSFGYLIIDTVVSPHDKMDVGLQNVKTIHITLKYVSGNVANLHGANCSLSLIFVTTE